MKKKRTRLFSFLIFFLTFLIDFFDFFDFFLDYFNNVYVIFFSALPLDSSLYQLSMYLYFRVYRGAFSEVYAAEKINGGKRFAVKCISKKTLNVKDEASLESEIFILKR